MNRPIFLNLLISGDGTFRITPYLWYKTFILHASVGHSAVPVVFALLPDKKKRSYEDLFGSVKRALEDRKLELSAQTFISDFEHNIRITFTDHFPSVEPRGCYFHYGKAIWSRVKKGGMATYYRKKREYIRPLSINKTGIKLQSNLKA